MKCPDCNNELQLLTLKGVDIYECFKCKGKWFDRKGLISIVNKADKNLGWLNFDPFGKDTAQLSELSVTLQDKLCPMCLVHMESFTYFQSKIVIDKCPCCEGVWLAHGEFARIVRYLEKELSSKSAQDLAKNTFKEFIKIFTGSKGLVSEVKDFLVVLYLLELRVAAEHPAFVRISEDIYLDTPFK